MEHSVMDVVYIFIGSMICFYPEFMCLEISKLNDVLRNKINDIDGSDSELQDYNNPVQNIVDNFNGPIQNERDNENQMRRSNDVGDPEKTPFFILESKQSSHESQNLKELLAILRDGIEDDTKQCTKEVIKSTLHPLRDTLYTFDYEDECPPGSSKWCSYKKNRRNLKKYGITPKNDVQDFIKHDFAIKSHYTNLKISALSPKEYFGNLKKYNLTSNSILHNDAVRKNLQPEKYLQFQGNDDETMGRMQNMYSNDNIPTNQKHTPIKVAAEEKQSHSKPYRSDADDLHSIRLSFQEIMNGMTTKKKNLYLNMDTITEDSTFSKYHARPRKQNDVMRDIFNNPNLIKTRFEKKGHPFMKNPITNKY